MRSIRARRKGRIEMADDRIRSRSVQQERTVVQPDGHDGNTVADGTVVRDNTNAYIPDGGAVAAPAVNAGIGETAQVIPERRILSWGAIWGGLLTGLAVFLILEFLLYAAGAMTTTSGGTITASGAAPWITGILGLFGFFVGGWVAEISARTRTAGTGVMNGLMVWSLGVGLIVAFSLLGLGSFFTTLGSASGGLLGSGSTVIGSARQATAMSQAISWGVFVWLILAAICAIIGGWLGSLGGANDRLTMRLPGRLVEHR